MKLLILTQYYPPETGAPQNRLHSLAKNLKNFGVEVEVLTAMPNYPLMRIFDSYAGKWFSKEEIEGVTVHRSFIYVKKSNSVLPRLLNYFSFTLSSLWAALFRLGRYDAVLCESPPLFLGITAYLIKLLKGSKFIFNISDLWPASAEQMGIVKNKAMLGMAYWLELFLYAKSDLITCQAQSFIGDIQARAKHLARAPIWLPNGVDFDQIEAISEPPNWRKEHGLSETDFLVGYAGLFGHAQDLSIVVGAAQQLLAYPQIKFILIGDGPERAQIEAEVAKRGLANVRLLGNMPRKNVLMFVREINASLVPLRKLDIFLTVIPSKIFEAFAFKKPILLGVDGESRRLFIDDAKGGIYFTPGDATQLAEQVLYLYQHEQVANELGQNGYVYVKKYFDRKDIAQKAWVHIQQM